jgi:monothiol glutaredoxin
MNNDEIRNFLQQAIDENHVMLFMKGTPDQPACGFSMRTSAALNALNVKYAALDILPDPRIRQELSALSDWPTIPQLFIDGKLVGGCDRRSASSSPSRSPRRRRSRRPRRRRSGSRTGSAD